MHERSAHVEDHLHARCVGALAHPNVIVTDGHALCRRDATESVMLGVKVDVDDPSNGGHSDENIRDGANGVPSERALIRDRSKSLVIVN